ncbi:APC family permease [Candidatus Nephthysia bennettiae]|uniref:APC family permease n=1 Tax=Candidatus Nephthysia bennettiae TaxID=3127016 RepID=A0A934K9Y9_9BACT|nr:APC family permease [Candidatus Dormibacteraeota bacterium]MBJ7612905.1 APC family permease [Candidatus Dormibacteraeota bacterium]
MRYGLGKEDPPLNASDGTGSRPGRRPGDVRLRLSGRRAKLPRTLGAPALFAACYGNVGSSIYYALGVTAAFALGLTPLALILAGGIFVTTALNYAEGTAAIPHAGGSSSFARRAFNAPIGFLVGWIQLLNYTATVSISAYFAIGYLGVFGNYVSVFKHLNEVGWHAGAALALTGLLIVVNIIGIQESSFINFSFALLDLGTQLVLVVLGVVLLLNINTVIHNVHWGVAPTWGKFLASISIAMVSYTGIETISNMSEEAKHPGRTVPKATWSVIAAVLFVSAFLPTIGMSVFPVHPDGHGGYITDLATTWKGDPVAGIVTFFRPAALAFWAGVWVAILAFTILVIATNAGLIGISRLSYSLASSDLFPGAFAKLHPKYRTPFISIAVFGVAAALLIIPGKIDLMASVYALAATFAFAIAHLAVMRLRFVEPKLHRPFRMPLNVRFGRSTIPVLSVIGAIAIGSVFTQLLFQNVDSSTFIYLGWLVVGVITFVVYRRHRRLPLWEPLADSPQPERVPHHLSIDRPPAGERVKIARRHPAHAPVAVVAPETAPRTVAVQAERLAPGRSMRRIAIWVIVATAVSLLALLLDLSPFDPFGPGLGWSPGVLLMVWVSVYLLARGRSEA